jgi:uncharacterized protein
MVSICYLMLEMKIEFDPIKSDKNADERQLPFERVVDFEWSTARVNIDDRFRYPEPRYSAFGFIGRRLHFLCFTPIPDGIRVISFRKANLREVATYEKAFKTTDK